MKKCENCGNEEPEGFSTAIEKSGLCSNCLVNYNKLKTIVESHSEKTSEKDVFVTNEK